MNVNQICGLIFLALFVGTTVGAFICAKMDPPKKAQTLSDVEAQRLAYITMYGFPF
jgi:hypothetical protein